MKKHNLHNTLEFLSEQLYNDTVKYNWNNGRVYSSVSLLQQISISLERALCPTREESKAVAEKLSITSVGKKWDTC